MNPMKLYLRETIYSSHNEQYKIGQPQHGLRRIVQNPESTYRKLRKKHSQQHKHTKKGLGIHLPKGGKRELVVAVTLVNKAKLRVGLCGGSSRDNGS